jgi:hypothetical protein
MPKSGEKVVPSLNYTNLTLPSPALRFAARVSACVTVVVVGLALVLTAVWALSSTASTTTTFWTEEKRQIRMVFEDGQLRVSATPSDDATPVVKARGYHSWEFQLSKHAIISMSSAAIMVAITILLYSRFRRDHRTPTRVESDPTPQGSA